MLTVVFRIGQRPLTRLAVWAWITPFLLVAFIFQLAACDGERPEDAARKPTGPESSREGPGSPSSGGLTRAVDPSDAKDPSRHPSSVEITAEQDAQIPPGPPGSVSVSRSGQVHVVEWKGTRDDTIQGYEVYKRRPPGKWVKIGRVKLRRDDERNRGTYRFEAKFNADCEYTVAAVGPDGKPGPKSADI